MEKVLENKHHDNLKIVVLDRPFYTIRGNKDASIIFTKILSQRFEGFEKVYGENILPFSTEDMLSRYVAICIIEDNEYIPLMSYKILDMRSCIQYGLKFPLINTLESASSPLKDEIKASISQMNPDRLGYIGNLANNPNYSISKDMKLVLRKLLTLSFIKVSEFLNIEKVMVTAAVEHNAHKYIHYLGFEYYSSLLVPVKELKGSSAYVMHLNSWSDQAIEDTKDFHMYWENFSFINKPYLIKQAS